MLKKLTSGMQQQGQRRGSNMLTRHIRFHVCLFLLTIVSFYSAAEKLIVGAQQLDYFPHYDFTSQQDKGVGWAILEAFASHAGYELAYVSLPVKRLQIELQKGSIDFVYPDNARWQNSFVDKKPKTFSQPIVHTLTGTFLKPEHLGQPMHTLKRIALPRGFSPTKWQQQIQAQQVQIVEVDDVYDGLRLLKEDEVNGINLEYHVIDYFTRRYPQLGSFTLDTSLPNKDVEFQLSTVKYPEVIEELNAFLISHKPMLDKIRQDYAIQNPETLLTHLTRQQHVADTR